MRCVLQEVVKALAGPVTRYCGVAGLQRIVEE
jgi:hypothetical protein